MKPKLETIGKVLASGWGDRVVTGILFGFIENVTPERIYHYIKEDKSLGYWLSEGDWEKYRKIVKKADVSAVGELTWQRVVSELRKRRLTCWELLSMSPADMPGWRDN